MFFGFYYKMIKNEIEEKPKCDVLSRDLIHCVFTRATLALRKMLIRDY